MDGDGAVFGGAGKGVELANEHDAVAGMRALRLLYHLNGGWLFGFFFLNEV